MLSGRRPCCTRAISHSRYERYSDVEYTRSMLPRARGSSISLCIQVGYRRCRACSMNIFVTAAGAVQEYVKWMCFNVGAAVDVVE